MLALSLWQIPCGVLLISLVCAQGNGLVQRAVTSSTSSGLAAPTPISISASENWDGPDGPWSTFTIRVGTPEQAVRVLISTASQQTWVILPEGCLQTDTICPDARGRVYNQSKSTTWSQLGKGYFELSVEQHLNISANGLYGHDTLGLGVKGSGGPTLQSQIIGGIGAEQYYLGMFGVNPKSTNFTGLDEEQPSYLASLKDQKIIPSLSFGYTAGAQYRLKKVLGSLTLGGYDKSRFTRNGLTFSFAPDNSRDLVVGLQSIISTNTDGTVHSLLPSGILAYVDSTVPQIWLPVEACQAFEEAFGLTYDKESKLYLVNDTLHDTLVAQDASITFTLGHLQTGGQTINITLPYDSFDLQATPPFAKKRTRYFPLQRAENDTQYTLGRTFLQEAYLIVDWERSEFSLSQCLFVDDSRQKLTAIPSVSTSPDGPEKTPSSSSPNGQKIGIGVGVALAIAFLVGILYFLYRRKQKRRFKENKTAEDDLAEASRSGYEKAELNTDNDHAIHEKGDGDHDQRLGPPRVPSSSSPWIGDEDFRGGISAVGELSADRVPQGMSPSEPLLGLHELPVGPGPPATPFELSADEPRELHGLSPETPHDSSAASPRGPSPLLRQGSSAPSSPTQGRWGNKRGTWSSSHGGLLTPSPPSRSLGDPSPNPEHAIISPDSLSHEEEHGGGQGRILSFLRGFSRPNHSARDT